jgi:hypothetical protein
MAISSRETFCLPPIPGKLAARGWKTSWLHPHLCLIITYNSVLAGEVDWSMIQVFLSEKFSQNLFRVSPVFNELHAMKTHRERKVQLYSLLNFQPFEGLCLHFTPGERALPVPILELRLCGPQNRSGLHWEKTNFLPLPRMEIWFFSRPTCSQSLYWLSWPGLPNTSQLSF